MHFCGKHFSKIMFWESYAFWRIICFLQSHCLRNPMHYDITAAIFAKWRKSLWYFTHFIEIFQRNILNNITIVKIGFYLIIRCKISVQTIYNHSLQTYVSLLNKTLNDSMTRRCLQTEVFNRNRNRKQSHFHFTPYDRRKPQLLHLQTSQILHDHWTQNETS